ncbi:hypothetical protein BGZ70_001370 [Mortierella alpina]|uniref:BAG domain-containing protein n=1 Tax=Mortierella alpina TaxID=64518 RepID=A0A9P6JBM5_MORAP|nr:hypothetical protein BGZ70_001370 [Mortierella alpina]
MEDPELYSNHRLKPQHYQQQHSRQQEEQRRRAFREQQQRQDGDADKEDDEEGGAEEEEEESERLRQIAKQPRQQQQQQQHHATAQRMTYHTTQDTPSAKQSHRPSRTQQQQQQRKQKPAGWSEEYSSARNRRQRRRDRQGSRSGGEATAAAAPQESVDDMQSLVEAAFGEKTMLSDSPGQAPKPKVASVSEDEGDSDEASDHIGSDQDNSATGEYPADEEESIQPDPEQQQRSLEELHEIECNLQELSQELPKILSGEITNKKHILQTEENLTKAMLRIDAVESGGDDSVRRQRKGLIDKAERLLEKVDEYKHRTKTCAFNRSH